jgi:hypothetical protein
MVRHWLAAGVLILAGMAPALVQADDRAAALAILERAIKAHGGAEALARTQISVRNGRGTAWLPSEMPFQSEMTANLPSQVRVTFEANRARFLTVINGNQGWQSIGGAVAELSGPRLTELQEENYVWWLATLTPLLKEGFELTVLPDARVSGRPAAGIQASSRGRPTVGLYFDKESGLLVRISRRAREPGGEVDKEYLLSDHKDFDGVKMPTREVVSTNGRKVTDVTYTSYKFLRKADEGAFARP